MNIPLTVTDNGTISNLEMDKIEQLKKELLIAIRTKIKREGWSQSEAGALCGLPRTHMNNVLRGTSDAAGFTRLFRVAYGLGLKVELVIRDTGRSKAE